MAEKKITDLTDEEIGAEIAEIQASLFKYRFQRAMGKTETPAKIRSARRQLARLKTAQHARALKAGSVHA
jgi:large subunit ribosomal protein L29